MDFEHFCNRFNVILNEQQAQAVRCVSGPSLILAVPGSGKTTAIVARVGYMMYCCNVSSSNILTLTYTRAAAREMLTRFCDKFEFSQKKMNRQGLKAPAFSTIHSLCYAFIRDVAKRKGISLPTLSPNSEMFLRKAYIKVLGGNPSEMELRTVAQRLTQLKNSMDGAASGVEEMSEIGFRIDMGALDHEYEEIKRRENIMDFDDLLITAARYMDEYADMLTLLQQQYKYINVDEAQDTSRLQHSIIQKIAARYGNICMVGDEDQSIYGFRAAYPESLLSFDATYPGARVFYMEDNYRSTPEIVNLADAFIQQNTERHEKHMKPVRKSIGIPPTRRYEDSMEGQYEHLVNRIARTVSEQASTSIAVLFRNNESAIPLIDLCLRKNVNINSRCSADLYFSHPLVMDVMSILQLSLDFRNVEAFSQLYYKLVSYTSRSVFVAVEQMLNKNPRMDIFEALNVLWQQCSSAAQKRRLEAFYHVKNALQAMADLSPLQALAAIWTSTSLGYAAYMERTKKEGIFPDGSIEQKKYTLQVLASRCDTIPEYLNRINILKSKSQQLERNPKESNATLSTLHSAKGMEFDEVIIIDATEDVIPASAPKNATVEEERALYEEEVRLWYVGVTRARTKLDVYTYGRKQGSPIKASLFVSQFFDGCNARNAFYSKVINADNAESRLLKGSQNTPPHARAVLRRRSNSIPNGYELIGALSDIRNGQLVYHVAHGYGVVAGMTDTGFLCICYADGQKIYQPEYLVSSLVLYGKKTK